MDYTTKVIQKKEFQIKSPKLITIGDPMYLEEIENPETSARNKKLVKDISLYRFKPSCCAYAKADIRLQELTYDNDRNGENTFRQVEINIAAGCNEDMPDNYLAGRWYGKQNTKRDCSLGCDTARFSVSVDGIEEVIDTGADGYYGHAIIGKQYFGYLITLWVDEDVMNMEEAEETVRYLFDVMDDDE